MSLEPLLLTLPGKKKQFLLFGSAWIPVDPKLSEREIVKRAEQTHFLALPGEKIGLLTKVEQLDPRGHYLSAVKLFQTLWENDCIAVLSIEKNLFWVVGFQNRQLLPGSDRCFSEARQAMMQFQFLKQRFSISKTYADPALEIPDAEAFSFQKFYQSKQAELFFALPQLTLIDGGYQVWTLTRWGERILWVLALLGLILGPWSLLRDVKRQKQGQQFLALQQQLDKQKQENAWRDNPPASEIFSLALNELKTLPTMLGGWELRSANFKGTSLQCVYAQTHKLSAQIISEEAARRNFTIQFDAKLSTATLTKTVPLPKATRQGEKLQPLAKARFFLENQSKVGTLQAKLGKVKTGSPANYTFSYSTFYDPDLFLAPFLDGLVIQSIGVTRLSSKSQSLQWSLSGTIYGTNT